MGPDLVCARCSGRVADGGCPTCRAARDGGPGLSLPAGPVLALALLVLVLLLALA